MKTIIVGIFDRKAQMFISMEPTPNINVSLRQLAEQVNTKSDSPLHKWSEDFSLWELGEFDTETGFLSPRENSDSVWDKKLIVECASLKSA